MEEEQLGALQHVGFENRRHYSHRVEEVSAGWSAGTVEEQPATVSEVDGAAIDVRLESDDPLVALWGDPEDGLELDLSIGKDLTQYVLSFEVYADGTLGDAVMES